MLKYNESRIDKKKIDREGNVLFDLVIKHYRKKLDKYIYMIKLPVIKRNKKILKINPHISGTQISRQ